MHFFTYYDESDPSRGNGFRWIEWEEEDIVLQYTWNWYQPRRILGPEYGLDGEGTRDVMTLPTHWILV